MFWSRDWQQPGRISSKSTVMQNYGGSTDGGKYLGGGFIPPGNGGQYLYLVADAEKDSSAIWELKLMRNGKLDSSFCISSIIVDLGFLQVHRRSARFCGGCEPRGPASREPGST